MNIKQKSFRLRADILETVYRAKAGHIGGDFSVCDILCVLYGKHLNVSPENFHSPDHDRLVLSKGHCVEALYAVLADKGFFPREDLASVSAFGSKYIGHPSNQIPGIEMCSGSLGHGLSVGAGMALAARMDGASWRTWVIMGDGELAEGSVWEGAMLAGHYKLDNLTAVIDRNRLQISGGTERVMSHEDLGKRWESFGWNVIRCAGNDTDALDSAFERAKSAAGKPTVVIASTVKGFGVSFMEDIPGWHHRVPTEEEYRAALEELRKKEEEAGR